MSYNFDTIINNIINEELKEELNELKDRQNITNYNKETIINIINTISTNNETLKTKLKNYINKTINKKIDNVTNPSDLPKTISYTYTFINKLNDNIIYINKYIEYIFNFNNYIGFDETQVKNIIIKYINIIKKIIDLSINITKKPQAINIPTFTRPEKQEQVLSTLALKNKYKIKYTDSINTTSTNINIDIDMLNMDILKLQPENIDEIIKKINEYIVQVKNIKSEDPIDNIIPNFGIPEYALEEENITKIKNVINKINELLKNITDKHTITLNPTNINEIIEVLKEKYSIKIYDKKKLDLGLDKQLESVKIPDIIKDLDNNDNNYKLFNDINGKNKEETHFRIIEQESSSRETNIKKIIEKYRKVIVDNTIIYLNDSNIFDLYRYNNSNTVKHHLYNIYINCINVYTQVIYDLLKRMITEVLQQFVVLDTSDTEKVYDTITGTLETTNDLLLKLEQDVTLKNPTSANTKQNKYYKQKYLKYKSKYLELKNN